MKTGHRQPHYVKIVRFCDFIGIFSYLHGKKIIDIKIFLASKKATFHNIKYDRQWCCTCQNCRHLSLRLSSSSSHGFIPLNRNIPQILRITTLYAVVGWEFISDSQRYNYSNYVNAYNKVHITFSAVKKVKCIHTLLILIALRIFYSILFCTTINI